jgi:hypothetical protein
MVQLEEAIADKQTVLGYLNSLKNSIEEESESSGLFMSFVQDIQLALAGEDYPKALHLIDELEEFMDLEFCEKRKLQS